MGTSCEKLFAGEAITEAETKEAALAWVPDAMRFDVASTAELVEDDGHDDDDAGSGADGDPDGDDDAGLDADESTDLGEDDAGAVNEDAELVAAE